MDEEEYAVSFKIIAAAGSAKSSAMLAIRAAREGDFHAAGENLAAAEQRLHEAHHAQTELLTEEARGNVVPVNVILVHAQDHLMGALLAKDLATEFIELYRNLDTPKCNCDHQETKE